MADDKMVVQVKTLQGMLASNGKAISSLLPAHVKPEMLMRTIFTAVTQTPKLLECSPASILRATLQAAMLGLPPNNGAGLAYLVPFNKKDGSSWIKECQLITGYRGLMLLARQGGDVGAIDAGTVHEGDFFEYEKGLTPKLVHCKSRIPAYADDGKTLIRQIVGAWCAASVHGERQFEFLEWWEIERIRNGSQGFKNNPDSSPWALHPGAMAMKTAVRAEMKFLPGSSERLASAYTLDDAHDKGERQQFNQEITRLFPVEEEKPPSETKPTTGDLAAKRNGGALVACGICSDKLAPEHIEAHRASHGKTVKCTGDDGEHAGSPCAAANCYLAPQP